MRDIYKIWYENKDKASSLYQKRLEQENTVKTKLHIHPMNQPNTFELYYAPTNSMINKMEKINENDCILTVLSRGLPGVAEGNFLVEVITEELQSSNAIEGVRSTRQEIAESTRRALQGGDTSRFRMKGMINSYLKLREGGLSLPEEPKDVRTIYDFVTDGEIENENLPDGAIFIKEGADVQGAAVGRVTHQGVQGEDKIIEHIEKMLEFLKDDQVPFLIRAAVGHYYFGYIHPFYDGNGRTSRFITSLFLSKRYSVYTAYSLSTGCRLEQKKYLDLFDKTNKMGSFGELNFAIECFFNVLITGQERIIEMLRDRMNLMHIANEKIDLDAWLQKHELAQDIAFLFCQAYFFSPDQGALTKDQVKEILNDSPGAGYSAYQVDKALEEIAAKGYLVKVKKKPKTFVLGTSFLERG